MGNKKVKINIIFIIIVILLIVTALMIRFEFNPISYFIGGDNDDDKDIAAVYNYNGVYRYRESLKDVYKVFDGCTVSYFDYYIVILNNDYYRYKSSCIGTFLLDEGNAKDLKIEENIDKVKYILFDEKQYLRNDLINEIIVSNVIRENNKKSRTIPIENYNFLLQQAEVPGDYFSIVNGSLKNGNLSVKFNFNVLDNGLFKFTILNNKLPLYNYTVDDLNKLPLLKGIGAVFSVVEPVKYEDKYAYTFKVYDGKQKSYDLEDKFPITVDGVTLNYTDNMFIKYSTKHNAFVVLVSKNEKMCEKNSDSNDVAYYEFHVKYNYVNKTYDNPKFIRKVYKKEGCSYFNDLMEE